MNISLHALPALLAAAIGVAGCSPGPAPVSQSPSDPSNPHAAEAVSPPSASPAVVTPSTRGPMSDAGQGK